MSDEHHQRISYEPNSNLRTCTFSMHNADAERTQHPWWQRRWLKAEAPSVAGNQRTFSVVTLDVTQLPMGWLKELAKKVYCA